MAPVKQARGVVREPGAARSSYRATAKFVVLFALLFLAGSKLHQVTREYTAPLVVGALNVGPSSALINLLTPSEGVRAVGKAIQGRATIQVGQGCDGVDGVLLLVSAVLAFPVSRRKVLLGLLIGVPLLYVCNLVRIAGLYYVLRHWPPHFTFMHENVGQTFIILVGSCFFLLWSGGLARAEAR